MEAAKTISLLLPTRGRTAQLQRLFESIVVKTANLKALEIVLYIDDDDLPTSEVSHPSLSLVKLIKPSGERMGRMNQLCYEASRGRYMMLMNDDVIFRTDHWDTYVVESFTRYPDDVALVYGNDLYQSEKLPTLPILSRRVCELIGGVCPTDYFNTYIDLHLLDIFKKLRKIGHQRIVYLENVVFEHAHYETGKSAMDETYKKKNEQTDDMLFITLEDDRWNRAKSLSRYIEGRKEKFSNVGAQEQVQVEVAGKTKSGSESSLLRRWFASFLSRGGY